MAKVIFQGTTSGIIASPATSTQYNYQDYWYYYDQDQDMQMRVYHAYNAIEYGDANNVDAVYVLQLTEEFTNKYFDVLTEQGENIPMVEIIDELTLANRLRIGKDKLYNLATELKAYDADLGNRLLQTVEATEIGIVTKTITITATTGVFSLSTLLPLSGVFLLTLILEKNNQNQKDMIIKRINDVKMELNRCVEILTTKYAWNGVTMNPTAKSPSIIELGTKKANLTTTQTEDKPVSTTNSTLKTLLILLGLIMGLRIIAQKL